MRSAAFKFGCLDGQSNELNMGEVWSNMAAHQEGGLEFLS